MSAHTGDRGRLTVPVLVAVIVAVLGAVLAGAMSTARAATSPGPSSMSPTLVGASGGTTLYIWGSSLGDPTTTVYFYCPVPSNYQAQPGAQTASATPTYLDSQGRWLAVTVPALPAASGSCLVAVGNSSSNPIPLGGLNNGTWSPVLTVASGTVPSVSAAAPSVVLSTWAATDPPEVTLTAGSGTDLTNATVRQVLCENNPAGPYPANANALTPTTSILTFNPTSIGAPTGVDYCALEVILGSGPYAGSGILVPGKKPPSAPGGGELYALGFKPPYTGPITVEIVNTTGIPDSELWVSVVGDPSDGGTASGFPGINTGTLSTLPFTGLPTYTKATSTTPSSASFQITNGLKSGDIYLSQGTQTCPGGGGPCTWANVGSGSAPSPQTSPFRYALAEFTYATNLYTDLTVIDQVGFSMSSALYTDSAGTALLANSNRSTGCLNTLVSGIEQMLPASAWSTANPDGTGGILRRDANGVVIGYVGAAKKPALYSTAALADYAAYVQNLAVAKGGLVINDQHNAANQPGEFAYTAVYSPTTDLWTLNGTMESGTATGPTITVEGTSLYSQGSNGGTGYAIYGEDGPFLVVLPPSAGGTNLGWGNGSQAAPYQYDDLVKTIYRDFIAGFAYGYWGSKHPASNPSLQGTSTGVAASYFTLDPRQQAYANAGLPSKGAAWWNRYDDLVRTTSTGDGGASGAYGTAYSDTFLPDALSPAIGTNAARLWRITLGDPVGCAELLPSPQSLVLAPGTPITVLPAGQTPAAGVKDDFVTWGTSGFTGPLTYAISPPLPRGLGLSFDTASGVISGTPKANVPRRVYTVTATDGTSTATAYVTLTVGDYSLTPPAQNPTGTISTSIAQALGPPVAYTLGSAWDAGSVAFAISPALPSGLTMSTTTGLISGTMPAQASIAFPYLVTVTDKNGGNATSWVTITNMGTLTPATAKVSATVGQPMTPTAAFTAQGFSGAALQYAVVGANALPTSLTINSATGVISGTPTATQPATVYTVQATASSGAIAMAQVNLTVTSAQIASPSPTAAPRPTPSPTPTRSPTPSPTPTPTGTPTVTPSPTPTPACTPPAIWDARLQQCVEIA